MKKNIDRDLLADIWNLLEQLQILSQQEVYENQEFYIDLLKLLFNKEFRQTIKTLRQRFDVPKHWYDYPSNIKPHHKELFNLQEKHLDAPKKPTDAVIVEVCATFGLNSLRYGWFVMYYLYYSDVTIGKDRGESLIAKGEYRHKAQIVIKRNNGRKNNSFDNQQLTGYIQFYGDTTEGNLEDFIKENRETLTNLKNALAPYPHLPLEKLRNLGTCKRDIEIFLLSQLDFSDSQIADIIQNVPTEKEQKLMQENFELLTDGKLTLSQRGYPLTKRKDEDIHHITESTIRSVIKDMTNEILENDKSVDKVDP